MSMITVPNLPAGWSLPSELNTARGRNFAARRLRGGMRGVSGLRGFGGLGQDDGTDSGITTDLPPLDTYIPVDLTTGGISAPIVTSPGPSPADLLTAAQSDAAAGLCASGATNINGTCFDPSNPNTYLAASTYSAPAGFQTSAPAGSTPPAAPNGYQWVQAANGAALSLAKVLAVSQGGTVMQLPNGQQIITGAAGTSALASSALSGTLGSMLPLLLLAGGAVLLFSVMGRGR